MERIIKSYLTNREKPPFSRRELISLFRNVIGELRRSKEFITRREESKKGEENEDYYAMLDSKKKLEMRVKNLQS